MAHPRSRLALGSALAVLALLSAAGGAGASALVGSKGIADDSVRGRDLHDGTVAGRDVSDGSLTSDEFASGLASSTSAGPDRVVTWSGSYTADGSTGWDDPLVTSTDTIPPSSELEGFDISVTFDRSACRDFIVVLQPESYLPNDDLIEGAGFLESASTGVQTHDVFTGDVVTDDSSATHLKLAGSCLKGTPFATEVEIPDFDFTVTFSVTQLETPATTTFN